MFGYVLFSLLLCLATFLRFSPSLFPQEEAPSAAEKNILETLKRQFIPDPRCRQSLSTILKPKSVVWEMVDGVPRVKLNSCRFRRIDSLGPQIENCLRGHRIVIIGDSVTRFQYLNLIHFLDKGTWPDPFMNNTVPHINRGGAPWFSWEVFYKRTTALFAPHESCDCHREALDSRTFENRYYSRDNISVTYLQFFRNVRWWKFSRNGFRGHWGFPPFKNKTRCKPGRCDAKADWEFDLEEAFRVLLPELRPTIVILNAGHWSSVSEYPDEFKAAIKSTKTWPEGQFIWKTTTHVRGGPRERPVTDDLAIKDVQKARWNVFDAWALTQSLDKNKKLKVEKYIDDKHLQAFVYQGLNEALLNGICERIRP